MKKEIFILLFALLFTPLVFAINQSHPVSEINGFDLLGIDITLNSSFNFNVEGNITASNGYFSKLESPTILHSYKKQSWLPVNTTSIVETAWTFERATTPLITPTSDTSGDALHPDVIYIPGGWNGYNYWMIMTPFNESRITLENPEILASNDGNTWIDPGTNPLDPDPAGNNFNSDPSLMLYKNTMYVYWREAVVGDGDRIFAKTSTDGVTWSNQIEVLDAGGTIAGTLASANIRNIEGTFYLWTIYTTPNTLMLRTSSSPLSGWSDPVNCTINFPGAQDLWHINIMYDGDAFYSIWTDADELFFGRSYNGTTWDMNGKTIYAGGGSGTWDEKPYQTSFIRRPGMNYFDTFYSAIDTSAIPKHRIGRGKLHWSTGSYGNLYGFTESNTVSYVTIKNARLRLKSDKGAVTNIITDSDTTTSGFDPRFHFQHGTTPVTKFTIGVDVSANTFEIGTLGLGYNNGLRIDSTGKVGINDITPTESLTVNGTTKITGNLTLGEKIVFGLGEVIDNIVDAWVRITGNLQVDGDVNVTGNLNVSGSISSTDDLSGSYTGGNQTVCVWDNGTLFTVQGAC